MTVPSTLASTGANRGDLLPRQEERILVLDFGSQTAQLIARRVRDLQVFCQLVRHDLSAERIRELAPKGIILSGGPASVYGEKSPQADPKILELGIPILGICYGMQWACQATGGAVKPGKSREFGRTECRLIQQDEFIAGLPETSTVWMSHGDQVELLNGEYITLAQTPTCPFAAVKHRTQPVYGLQFHPEVTHSEFGKQLLENFVKGICHCRGTWKISSLIEQEVTALKQRVGNSRVICGLSGGVDSSVTAAILAKAIGKQLSCIFVDNGLLRQGESDKVRERFERHFQTDLHVVDRKSVV